MFYSKIFAIYSNTELKANKADIRNLVTSLNVDLMTNWTISTGRAKSTIIRDAMASEL